jgi:hypothetical protein
VDSQIQGDGGGPGSTAIEVPGTAALNTGGSASLSSVSCPSAGNCSTGGYYTDSSGHQQAFVVSSVNGTWGTAIQVPGTAALKAYWGAAVNSVSCATAGNCTAGGYYADGQHAGHDQAFVVSQVNGTWGKAIEVPGTATLNADGDGAVNSVSCAGGGTCSAGGYYSDGSGTQAFVVSRS